MKTLRRTSTVTAFFGMFLFTTVTGYSQAPAARSIWKPITESNAAATAAPSAVSLAQAHRYKAMQLNMATLNGVLRRAPMEFTPAAQSQPLEVTLPMPDGSMASFEIVESPVMAPELAAKFPKIKTYMGRGIDDPTASVRLSVTPKGFRAQILSASGASYIDPLYRGNTELYMCYRRSDMAERGGDFDCVPPPDGTESASLSSSAVETNMVAMMMGGGEVTLRTFSLAVAATGHYTEYHDTGNGDPVGDASAAIAEAVNRINGIYERELAIRLELVANNDLLIFTDPATDGYDDGDEVPPGTPDWILQLWNANQSIVDGIIGFGSYDIGHVFGVTPPWTTGLGSGVAGVGGGPGVVCSSNKARGVTTHKMPEGDPFWVDYTSHEMGHQFNANHTWNGIQGSCSSSSYVSSVAYEPGSGSTIMAYAGICGTDNLQLNSDPYFHSASIEEILNYVAFLSCDTESASGNHSPTVDAGPNYTIPKSTPFTLTPIDWDDPDGDPLIFSWEQRDLSFGQRALCALDDGIMPLFRFFSPTQEPSRTFPRLESILTLDTQTQSQLCVTGEQLPTTNRTMNFRVTVRDSVFGGGGTGYDDMAVSVVSSAGPFKVTSFDDPCEPYAGCSPVQVDWDVVNTNQPPIDVDFVNILLSVDGGQTFPFTLAANTPNDGVEIVEFPGYATKKGRVKIEAVDNIFFDISDDDIEITYGGGACQGVHNVTQDIWYNQVQPAINGAVNGDMIVVYPGFYDGGINLLGKAITLTGADPTNWDIVDATEIFGDGGTGYVATLDSGEDSNTVIRGLKLYAAPGYSIRFVGSGGTVQYCNLGGARSGVRCEQGADPTIENNRIFSFTYTGVYITADSPATVRNNWIYGYGYYGIDVAAPGAVIEGNTLIGGSPAFGFNDVIGIKTTAASLSATNCIIQNSTHSISGNVTLTYSCVDDSVPGATNLIYTDPLFVDPDNYDYHLQSNSPCRNMGNPGLSYNGQSDIDGQPRLLEGAVDMGADEIKADTVLNTRTGMEYAQIQDAVDDAALGDTLLVYPGTYGSVDFGGKAVTVTGTDPDNWSIVEDTLIDGTGNSYGALFNSGEGPDSILTGVTLAGGSTGIWCDGGHPTVHRCLIRNNLLIATYIVGTSSPILTNNRIENNNWYAVYVDSPSSAQVLNNLVKDNHRGMNIYSPTADVANNTIVGNQYGIFSNSSVTFRNCIVWNNVDGIFGSGNHPTFNYCCLQETMPGTGNIYSNPQFVDQAGGDYHLKSVSPCRNTGDPSGNYSGQTDIDGDARVVSGTVDMGADEYVP